MLLMMATLKGYTPLLLLLIGAVSGVSAAENATNNATAGQNASASEPYVSGYGVVALADNGSGGNATGAVHVQADGNTAIIKGLLSGLDPEKDHIVYIGASADFSDGCQSTGGVWAPASKDVTNDPSSMGRDEDDAPAGYLGAVEADNVGVAFVNIDLPYADLMEQLIEDNQTIPQVIVVAALEDENQTAVGQGGNYSGTPVACGTVEPFFPLKSQAMLINGPSSSSNATGILLMQQPTPETFIVTVNIRGLNSSRDDVLLGLLIHEGNSSDPESCAANITGPRYYPFSTNAKQMNVFMDSEIAQQYFMMREFAFFKPNADGAVEDLVLSAPNIYLWGPYSIEGRSWVLYELQDDDDFPGELVEGAPVAGIPMRCGDIMPAQLDEQVMAESRAEGYHKAWSAAVRIAGSIGIAILMSMAIL